MGREMYGFGSVEDATVIPGNGLVALDGGYLVPAADEAWDTNLATTQENFIAKFAGVYGDRGGHANGDGLLTKVSLKMVGEQEFDCASATFAVFDLVGPAKQSGNALENKKVVAVANRARAIGFVTKDYPSAVTKVRVQFFEQVSGISTTPSGAVLPDGTVPMTADLDMGGFQVTNMAVGAATGDAVEFDQMEAAVAVAQAAADAAQADATQALADAAAAVQADGSVAMTAALPFGGFKATGLAAPTATGDAARLDEVRAGFSATLTPGAEDGSDNIDTAIQVKDCIGTNLDHKVELLAWTSATEAAVEEAQDDMSIVTAGTLIKEETANACQRFLTNATGAATVRVQKTGGVASKWLNVRLPDGRIASTELAYA